MATPTPASILSSSVAPGTGKHGGVVATFPNPANTETGPGTRLLLALVEHWGTQIQNQPVPGHLLLPGWWRVLCKGAGISVPAWDARWSKAVPAGDWAPNALVLLTHNEGGTLAVDLDMDDEGTRGAWWHDRGALICASADLAGLIDLMEQGPSCLEKLRSKRFDHPLLVHDDRMPFDPISRQWQGQWECPMSVWRLHPGQGLPLKPGWSRHPTRPLVALPQ